VICGDPKQVDLPDPGKSGLADAVAKLEGIPKISMIRFGPGDVVRHPLVGRIVEAYEGPAARSPPSASSRRRPGSRDQKSRHFSTRPRPSPG